ncbi:MAG: inverse autotransporter beta domain-containing protein, partial [Thermodesulfobacteriota bacterium]
EHYITPTLDYSLNLLLPLELRKSVGLEGGYDRLQGLPTGKADLFVPIKTWKDRSFFFTPRVSLEGKREAFSMGTGFRRKAGDRSVIGMHAFHDWVRPRGSQNTFLRQAGFGVELSSFPGTAQLTLGANVYVPVNERHQFASLGKDTTIVREALSHGIDGRLSLTLPALTEYVDTRIDARIHRFWGEESRKAGHEVGISLTSRNGMFSGSFRQFRQGSDQDHFKVEGAVTLAFDWMSIMNGVNPFSAPYPARPRLEPDVNYRLYQRVARTYDVPGDRRERKIALTARVSDDVVSFSGAMPELANARLAVQTSQSPWVGRSEVTTDSRGFYSGSLILPPGQYKLRLIHESSGRTSEVTRVRIYP